MSFIQLTGTVYTRPTNRSRATTTTKTTSDTCSCGNLQTNTTIPSANGIGTSKGLHTHTSIPAYDPRHTPPPTPQSSSSATSPQSSPRQQTQQLPTLPGNMTSNNLELPNRPQRRKTNSDMPSFMVSAPGKVIVYGEHAVVYGKVRLEKLIGGGMIG